MITKTYHIGLEISLLIILIFSELAFAQEALVPFQEIYYGEPLVLKYTLVQEGTGNPLLGASIRAKTDFFDVYLFDDGQHEDGNAGDGIYGNVVNTTAEEGTYVITYNIRVDNITRSTSGSFKILPKPLLTIKQIGYILIGTATLAVVAFFLYKKLMGKKVRENKIKFLKKEREKLTEMMKKAEHEYYTRMIDENTFTKRVEKYKEEMIRIDLELKDLEAQVKKPKAS